MVWGFWGSLARIPKLSRQSLDLATRPQPKNANQSTKTILVQVEGFLSLQNIAGFWFLPLSLSQFVLFLFGNAHVSKERCSSRFCVFAVFAFDVAKKPLTPNYSKARMGGDIRVVKVRSPKLGCYVSTLCPQKSRMLVEHARSPTLGCYWRKLGPQKAGCKLNTLGPQNLGVI